MAKSYKELKQESETKCYLIAEEIELYTGLKTSCNGSTIEVDTMAKKMNFNPDVKQDIMHEVYRFIMYYGSVLHSYGRDNRIKKTT